MGILLAEPSRLSGRMELPPSKSEVQRLLLMAVCGGESCILSACPEPLCDDIAAMRSVIRVLGAASETQGGALRIDPGRPGTGGDCYVQECATALRMSLPVFLGRQIPVRYHMKPVLARRVMPGLRSFAEDIGGVTLDCAENGSEWVISVAGRLPSLISVRAGLTSQYLSGLMIACAGSGSIRRLAIQGPIVSRAYLDMTVALLCDYGCRIWEEHGTWVLDGSGMRLPERVLPGRDYSAAAVALALDVWGADIALHCENPLHSLQGDALMPALLRRMGGEAVWKRGWLRLYRRPYRPLTLNCDSIPDIAPALALAAARVPGRSRLTGLQRLRGKECDRFEAGCDILRRFGVNIRAEGNDSWIIDGGSPLHGADVIDSRGDHRMAMLAVAASFCADTPCRILGAECIAKSWPLFPEECARLGGVLQWQTETV